MGMESFEGKRVTVMGLGAFGGGSGVTRWLAAQGADVLVTDMKKPEELAESVEELKPLIDRGRVRLRLGEHNVSDFTDTDLVVANPAVPKPWDNRYLRAAEAGRVPVTTEMQLLVERLPFSCVTIGITGSNGKSTTSAMIAHILEQNGRPTVFGGNIGGSLLPLLGDTIGESTFVVLELSSAMLYWLSRDKWSPHVAVVTTFAANHLDWHGEVNHYRDSKQALLRFQRPGDLAVLGADAREWPTGAGVARQDVPAEDRIGGLRIPGVHNQRNAAVAVRAALAADATLARADVERAVRTFGGLPHRLALVGEIPAGTGVARCYNDSKCTTPEACLLAIEAFETDPAVGAARVHLIAGGYDKKVDLGPVAALATKLGGLYTVGQTGPQIAAKARESGGVGKTFECETLAGAVSKACERLRAGDVLLLSPACASWGQFKNYEDRGEQFAAMVAARSGTR